MFMHSCSNELYLKFSKPKISSIPITLYSPLKNTSPTRRNWSFKRVPNKTKRIYHLVLWKDNKLLMELTSQSNSRLYNARAMASLVAMASDTELFLWMISPLVTTLFTLKHSNRSELSMSNRHEARKERRRHEINPAVHSYACVIVIGELLLWIGVRSITVLLLSVLLSVMISPNSMSPKCNMAARMQYMELTSSSLKPTCSKAFFSWANLSTLVWKQNDDMRRV